MPAEDPPKKRLTYAESGVDVEVEEAHIKKLVGALGYARTSETGAPIAMPGGYAGLVRFGENALVLCTDGVGSKVEIARALGRYDTVGIDCMAMNVNDALCVGAEPIAFVDYLAVEQHDTGFMEQVGSGLAAAAEMADVTIVGGETATLPGIVKGFDLAGTCLGWVAQDRILDGTKVQEGDTLIGLPSFGIHSNGYTLVRRIVEEERLAYTDPFPGHGLDAHTLGEVLLEPTRIYVRTIRALLSSELDVHGFAHVTGGGLMNLPRIAKGHRFVVSDPLKPQPVFDWLQEAGGVETREMYRTFNMGMGFTAVVAADDADDAVRVLRESSTAERPRLVALNQGEAPRVIGRVETGTGCLLEKEGLEFGSKT